MPRQPYRPPAWPGLKPARPIYAPAHPGDAAAITTALGIDAPVFRLQNAGGATATFRVGDAAPLFVKLVDEARWRELSEAEAVARWLAGHGAPAIAARDLDPPRLPNGNRVVAYPYAEGRPPSPSIDDARALGGALAQLHRVLATHPDIADWQSRTDRRLDRLNALRIAIAEGKLCVGPRPDDLRALAADRTIAFLPGTHRSGPARPLHGDLNIFNIVIESGEPRFIDFEDAVHSVLSPENELALICERVFMVQEPSDSNAAAAIDVFLNAYADGGGDPINRAALSDVLRGLSLRSLCTLADIDRRGRDVDEWQKFFGLIDAAERRRGIFS